MRVLATAILALMLTDLASAQGWSAYVSRRDFFTVNFPGKPEIEDFTYTTEYAITLPGRRYHYSDGDSRYSVDVVDYTEAVRIHEDRAASCRAELGDVDSCNVQFNSGSDMHGAVVYASWQLMQRASEVTHFTFATADNVEGQQLQLLNADGSRTFAAVFMHEDRLYVIEGTVPANAPAPGLFQQSLQFLDENGNKIRYRSFYSNGFPPPPSFQTQ